MQFDKIQRLIDSGISEGAPLWSLEVRGGPWPAEPRLLCPVPRCTAMSGRAQQDHRARGSFRPLFCAILSYENEAQAVSMANDTVFYGVSRLMCNRVISSHARAIASVAACGSGLSELSRLGRERLSAAVTSNPVTGGNTRISRHSRLPAGRPGGIVGYVRHP